MQDRRTRTRHLIELGGLVHKAGLVDLLDDDRATLLGAFLDIANQLRIGEEGDDRNPQQLAAAWRRRGLRAFDADKEAIAMAPPSDRVKNNVRAEKNLRLPPDETPA